MSDESIVHEYLKYQELYQKKYGEYTIVLMEVGSFFEIYGIETDDYYIGKVTEVTDLLNIQKTRKKKSNIQEDYSNPLMAGFPNHALSKFLNILLNNNYTVVLIEQVSQPPKPRREITRIISPGTNIYENNIESNNLMSIYIEFIKQQNNSVIPFIGISIIDSTTGKNSVFETSSNINDKDFGFEEIIRMKQVYNPREIIVNCKNSEMKKGELLSLLELNENSCHIKIDDFDKNFLNNKFQNKFLGKIFNNTGMLSPIEYLDLEQKIFGIISYVFLLQFAYEHDERILTKLGKPCIEENSEILLLANNTIQQLNITSVTGTNNKRNSLIAIINNTSTPMGKRLFNLRLLNPIIDSNILNKRYNYIETMLEDNRYIEFEKILKNVHDIERLHRRLTLSELHPSELASLDLQYMSVLQLFDLVKKYYGNDLELDESQILEFKNFIKEYSEIFNIENLNKYNINSITGDRGNIFNKNISEEIDSIYNDIQNSHKIFNILSNELSKYIDEKNKTQVNTNVVKIEKNDRDGTYLMSTKKRYESLEKNFKNKKIIINLENNDKKGKKIEFKLSDITPKHEKNNTKIYSTLTKNTSDNLVLLYDKFKTLSNEYYIEKLVEFNNKYINNLIYITNKVSEIDVIKSCAKSAIIYNYKKPKIILDNSSSHIKAEKLRHPIIERINCETEYIPNDIKLGIEEQNGILLYSVNAAGKSSLMKSVGINVIMAQAGMYVSADSFEFKPYKSIFTRISNNDNLFKGQSTFAVEMSELRGILTRANNSSLVLGDELCSGTETTSAIAIVATGIKRLSSRDASFIFATHLHKLSHMEFINSLNNVKHYHLKVSIDSNNNSLVYERTITPGSGTSIYGLEVCKAMGLDNEFLEVAHKLRRNLSNIDDNILTLNKSKYNSNVIIDKCLVCSKKGEDIHHINFQCNADENNMIGNYHKNIDNNLVCLCKKCHDEVHNGRLKINGYKYTDKGNILDYCYIEDEEYEEKKKSRKKFTPEQLEVIYELKKTKYKKKDAVTHLKIYNNINISVNTISKIWKNEY